MGGQYLDYSGTIKLLIDRETEIVVLGEADEAYKDLHNSALCFPMATAVRLARTQERFRAYACFTNLYHSVQGLSLQCFKTPTCKHMLLHPRYMGQESLQVRLKDDSAAGLTRYFTCDDFCKRGSKVLVSYYETIRCDCGKFMNKELHVLQRRQGFEVKEQHRTEKGRYVLSVMESVPYMLNKTSAKHLKRFPKSYGIKCMSQLKEKPVTVCLEQISSLLLNSAVLETPLMDTFIGDHVEMEARKDLPLISSTKKSTGKAAAPLTVEVLVRKSDNRILFAVAQKDFIDLLFTFLTLPLMMVWDMIGFPFFERASVEPQAYKLPPYYSCHRLLPSCNLAEVPPLVVSSRTKRAYESHMCLLDDEELVCLIDPKSPIRDSTDSNGGYAKHEQVFLVSDDLVVHQGASTSTILLAEEFGIPLPYLETQKICIGEKEALQLLEASFRSSSALTIGLGSLISSRSTPRKWAFTD